MCIRDRFPYRVGQYGGAAFLLIYFGFVALFGWVGLSGEFAFGRLTGTGLSLIHICVSIITPREITPSNATPLAESACFSCSSIVRAARSSCTPVTIGSMILMLSLIHI